MKRGARKTEAAQWIAKVSTPNYEEGIWKLSQATPTNYISLDTAYPMEVAQIAPTPSSIQHSPSKKQPHPKKK